MTKETLTIANSLVSDIKSLKNIKEEIKERHWIGFYGSVVHEQTISSFGLLREDFEKFIDDELEKLEKELEKL